MFTKLKLYLIKKWVQEISVDEFVNKTDIISINALLVDGRYESIKKLTTWFGDIVAYKYIPVDVSNAIVDIQAKRGSTLPFIFWRILEGQIRYIIQQNDKINNLTEQLIVVGKELSKLKRAKAGD